MVYGELGAYPLHVLAHKACIRYWLRLLKLGEDRLPKVAYEASVNLAEQGKECWAGRVRDLLMRHGFGEVWVNQGVGQEKKFLREFVSRLRDGFVQEWDGKVERSDRFAVYRLLRQGFGRPNTTTIVTNPGRDALVRLKFGVSGLKSHVCR